MGRTDKEIYRVIDNVNSYYRLTSESKKELLLNKYPNAAAAYSLRLLDGYYRGPLVRVRRTDGVEVDVYPDYNNELSLDSLVTNVDVHTTNDGIPDADATFLKSLQSLGEFVSNPNYVDGGTAVDATVCVWYDQSSTDGVPNDNDAKQAVATNQPLIVSSGVIVTDNGKPAIESDGNDSLDLSSDISSVVSDYTIFDITRRNRTEEANRSGRADAFQSFGGGDLLLFDTETGWLYNDSAYLQPALTSENQTIKSFSLVAPTALLYEDGVNVRSGSYSQKVMSGAIRLFFERMVGTRSEIIFYTSDQSTNRSDIEEDINSFYQIDGYTPTPKLIDLTQDLAVQNGGTTADGTPAAAYSLRLLSSTYNDPLVRIRRTIDNTEVDVYPDSDGEFSIYSAIEDGGTELTTGVTGGSTDKTTLHEFLYGQDTDCMVVVWYDQSGNANDATQTTAASQPKIYDSSTGVVTDLNGKPEMLCTLSRFNLTTAITLSSGYSCIHVSEQSARNSVSFGGSVSYHYITLYQNSNVWFYHTNSGRTLSYVVPLNTKELHWLNWTGTTVGIGVDGGSFLTGALSTTTEINHLMFASGQIVAGWQGRMQEMIIYPSDQSSNRSNIESNINQHYNIY